MESLPPYGCVRPRGEGEGRSGRADGSGFFTVMTLLEGKDMSAVKEKWRQVSRVRTERTRINHREDDGVGWGRH